MIKSSRAVSTCPVGARPWRPATRFIAKQAAGRQPVYHYHFSYVPQALRGEVHGAAHGSDISFVFRAGGEHALTAFVETDEDRAMAMAMNAYWVNFARTGDPNGAGLPEWPVCPSDVDATMVFGIGGPRAETAVLAERLDYVEPIARAAPLR